MHAQHFVLLDKPKSKSYENVFPSWKQDYLYRANYKRTAYTDMYT